MIGVASESGWVRSTTSTVPPASASTREESTSTGGSLLSGGVSGVDLALDRRLLRHGAGGPARRTRGPSGRPFRCAEGPGELEAVLQQVQVHVEAGRAHGLD